MSRHDPAARAVAQSGPPRWDATPARMGFDGAEEGYPLAFAKRLRPGYRIQDGLDLVP